MNNFHKIENAEFGPTQDFPGERIYFQLDEPGKSPDIVFPKASHLIQRIRLPGLFLLPGGNKP